ncbi:MAG: hypothetical protein M1816_005175 [Peltula sp. TS41687]|nr:MAG: hypothetical protein M1816_005175 [Peltula sp. TS41687]
MAKSLRASNKKGNKARLRSKVFGPVEDARTERLSAKLLELATSAMPVATPESTMDIDKTAAEEEKSMAPKERPVNSDEMDVDDVVSHPVKSSTNKKGQSSSRVQKKGRRKGSSSILFPSYQKGKRLQGSKSKKK